MRRITAALILAFCAVPAFSSPGFLVPESAVQGGVIRIVLEEAVDVFSGEAYLIAPDGRRISTSPFFPVWNQEGTERYVSLAGVGSTYKPGTWLIRIAGIADGIRISEERTIEILAVRFREEEIPLNEAMSDLRQSDDPRKEEESRALWALLSRSDTPALAETGNFILPLPVPVRTSYYGDRRTYLYTDGQTSGTIHFGIDYAANRGTPVRAAGAGEIVFAAERILTGNTVVIEHLPGVFTLYYHMDTVSVFIGDTVGRGAEIGTVGKTGLATGNHLHWELRVGTVPVDPERFLSEPLVF